MQTASRRRRRRRRMKPKGKQCNPAKNSAGTAPNGLTSLLPLQLPLPPVLQLPAEDIERNMPQGATRGAWQSFSHKHEKHEKQQTTCETHQTGVKGRCGQDDARGYSRGYERGEGTLAGLCIKQPAAQST